ncbi:hypothetical protein G5C60_07680 [Streptomyces sp. HC44]|uniref:Uncharacterized protein n=1 Tax=Streptomyces scabichelini TaxID=2711217 RepID=A0A6G4V0L3_9ACTN|nr:hypothetical protein [Streptomyces scabichelini]NGO07536.1 hypothetical protein [Streptomyces scabichelini]
MTAFHLLPSVAMNPSDARRAVFDAGGGAEDGALGKGTRLVRILVLDEHGAAGPLRVALEDHLAGGAVGDEHLVVGGPRQRSVSCTRPPGSGTRSAASSHAINLATSAIIPGILVAHG